ncbi:MAG: pantetheine-phosphate adenylyltransferase [Chloroflexota bacterium]|nr:pantetheine-phosphate adenylyltransferase [Chloroflexota bacterium]
MLIALYPGSFDPITNGHIDVITRAAALFDELVVGVFDAPPKNLSFNTEERVKMVRDSVTHLKTVHVKPYAELTVNFADSIGAKVIVRGLRMGSDFEREFDMALMNKKLAPHIESLCLMASAEHQFISSSLLKEVVQWDGCIEEFVPKHVAAALRKKYC